ncbi:MAG TPA: TldD/PmbA family protein [Deltaproteobacteria bacterium]|nr:TldD/PmbA family protein [Deltaproteobacteria bacterium]
MDLDQYSELFSGYTELRVQQNTRRTVALLNGDVVNNTSSVRGGASARVWDRGMWGFASGADTSTEAIRSVVDTASRNASYLAGRAPKELGPLQHEAVRSDDVFGVPGGRWSSAEVVDFLKTLDAAIAERHPGLQARELALLGLDMEKHLLTSEGSASDSLIPRTNLLIRLSLVHDGVPFRLADIHGGFGQGMDALASIEAIGEAIDQQVEHLQRKAEGVYASAGAQACVLDAELAGILAHEAIGHTTEADLVLGGSIAGGLVGEQVASPLVSLTDFANTALGRRCPVPVYVDDEGTPSRDVPIIVDGVLEGFMHNKETALRLGCAPTGNARAFTFSDEPLVRMRNTSFLPGSSKLEEMIASVDEGYYLMRSSNGQADATSEFMFGVVLGYEIKDGRLGKAIRDTTISGVAFDVLKTVSMVSDDMVWQSAGMCGKKQPIPVGMGGPAIKCTLYIGGQ